MPESCERAQITLSTETIHNPAEPRHFMRIKPVKGRVRILFDDHVLAESNQALRLLEVGRDIYDPVFYLPMTDIQVELISRPKQTFCPLKGHASYFDLVLEQGDVQAAEIAWSYQDSLDIAEPIKDKIAFDASQVIVEEYPSVTSE